MTTSGCTDGPAMVFVHGFGCDQNMWRFVAPAFEDRYRVVLLDLVGAGGSDLDAWSSERYSLLNAHADDVIEVCRSLELRDVVFVGHSVSAMIGTLACIVEPDLFAGLVMVSPSPRYLNDRDYVGGFERADIDDLLRSMESNYLGWSSVMAPVIMGVPEKPEHGLELTASFCRTDPSIARHFASLTFLGDSRADLAQLTVRTLVLQCSHDAIAPLGVGEFVHQSVVDSAYVQMAATGHCPNLSAPEETISVIEEFLRG